MRLKRVMGYVNWKRGRERLNDMAMLARLVADLRAQSPDHVAMTGDVVNIGLAGRIPPRRGVDAHAWASRPTSVSRPGNHDAYVRDAMKGLAETFAPWTAGDADADGHDRFPFLRVRGDVALIGLSSGVPTGAADGDRPAGRAADRRTRRSPCRRPARAGWRASS